MYIWTISVAYKLQKNTRGNLTHAQMQCVCVRIVYGYSLYSKLFIDFLSSDYLLVNDWGVGGSNLKYV